MKPIILQKQFMLKIKKKKKQASFLEVQTFEIHCSMSLQNVKWQVLSTFEIILCLVKVAKIQLYSVILCY